MGSPATTEVAALVLAAGLGTRLRPLTDLRPKALCPVANVPLVDLALERLGPVTDSVAVNVHHHRDQLERHLAGRVHLSIEEAEPLGTAGAVGHLREWIAGRGLLVVNADAWSSADLAPLVDGWDGERIRILVADAPGDLGPVTFRGASLLPWRVARDLAPVPSGLFEVAWRNEIAAGLVDWCRTDAPFVDCGTPARYLQANLAATGGASVVGPGAVVEGTIERCVVWSGARVRAGEHLVDAIRAQGPDGPLTVSGAGS